MTAAAILGGCKAAGAGSPGNNDGTELPDGGTHEHRYGDEYVASAPRVFIPVFYLQCIKPELRLCGETGFFIGLPRCGHPSRPVGMVRP
jgi:hypothetical protein